MNPNNTFRIFVKDLLNPKFDQQDIRLRWNRAEGLYESLAKNKSGLNMFGIRITEDIPEKIVIKIIKNNIIQIFHIYSEDNVVGMEG